MVGLHLRVSLTEGPIWIAHLTRAASHPQVVICGDVFGRFGGQAGVSEGAFLDEPLWQRVAGQIGGRASVRPEAGGMRVTALGGLQPTPTPVAGIGPDQAALIAGYVPDCLRDLLDATLTDWLAEFRSSHILFARFAGFGFQGEAHLPGLAILAAGTAQAIETNGGFRLKFGTDGKGLILLAAWGLQSRSFADNAERALAAAAAVRDAAQAAGFAASIGEPCSRPVRPAGRANPGGCPDTAGRGKAVPLCRCGDIVKTSRLLPK